MFSERVPSGLAPNRITRAVRRARATGRALCDLTVSNPTTVGIAYPDRVLEPLASAAALRYEPQPFGLADARQAVGCDYARLGVAADPDRIVLTASTSDAYSLLFKLLCAPGETVMVPVPSYPLFEHLAALDAVRTIPYRLDYHGRWALSIDEVERHAPPTMRAVLAVSPNNPTGSVSTEAEYAALASLCATRGAALIVDEVFADYPVAPEMAGRRVAPSRLPPEVLSFRLGGLSKSAGLPQVKLGWMLVDGPDALVRGAMDRLEVICDTYLAVSTPVQVAARGLLSQGAAIRAQILARIRANDATLRLLAGDYPSIEVLPTEAGWSSVVRVPSTVSEEDLVVGLLDRDDVLVHPGFFFDFPHEAFVIVSLLPEPDAFARGVRRVMERAHA